MTAEHLRNLLLKEYRLIILCVLLALAGAFVGTVLSPHVYQSQTTLQVDFPATDVSVVLGVDKLIVTEVRLATTADVLREAAAGLPGVSEATLVSEVSAAEISGTQLFVVTALDSDPVRAAAIANRVADVLIHNQEQATGNNNVAALQGMRNDLAATGTNWNAAAAKLKQLQMSQAPQSQVAAQQTTVNALQQLYNQLATNLATAERAQAERSSFLDVVQQAMPSSTAKRPYLALNLGIGLLAGLLLGVLIVLVRNQFDQRLRSLRQFEVLLGLPVLAEVSPRSLAGLAPDSPLPSGYDVLTTNLGYLSLEMPLRTLVVFDAHPHGAEGAGVVARNLAISAARSGSRTLLVDADLAHPSQAACFGVVSTAGLTSALLAIGPAGTGSVALDAYLQAPATGDPHLLRLLPSGPVPPNPNGILRSRAMRCLSDILVRSEVGYIVIAAAAPSNLETAAAIVAPFDAAVIVVDRARARRDQLGLLAERLREAEVNVVGCVVLSDAASGGGAAPAQGRGRKGRAKSRQASSAAARPPVHYAAIEERPHGDTTIAREEGVG